MCSEERFPRDLEAKKCVLGPHLTQEELGLESQSDPHSEPVGPLRPACSLRDDSIITNQISSYFGLSTKSLGRIHFYSP